MTNRELFNKRLREKMNEQLRYLESLSDEQLVSSYTKEIKVDIHAAFRQFKGDNSGSIGCDSDIIAWLADTSAESNEDDAELVPVKVLEGNGDVWRGCCPYCKKNIDTPKDLDSEETVKFCYKCGQRVRWK